MNTQHTQGEISCSKAAFPDNVGGWDYALLDAENKIIGEVFEIIGEGIKVPAKSNAEHLATCWNNFYPMLDALREVSPIIDRWINATPSGEGRNELTDLNIQIKAAINAAEATGKQQTLTTAEADLIIKDQLS